MIPSLFNPFFLMENVINSNCIYLCRTIYFIDILKMSFQPLEGIFSNTCQEIRSLLADMCYTASLTLWKVSAYISLRLFLQAHPFAIIENWHRFPFPKTREKETSSF